VQRTRIKFCGITDPIDAQVASRCGADAIGMILYAKSPRLIDADRAVAIARSIPPMVSRVGVFVDANAAFVAQTARALPLDYVQLHGRESLDYVRSLHAFRVIRAVTLDTLDAWRDCDLPNLVALLIDSGPGGTGTLRPPSPQADHPGRRTESPHRRRCGFAIRSLGGRCIERRRVSSGAQVPRQAQRFRPRCGER
jgi:phosphoribosylanthranilate isomerase